jgi:pimeloyl-ACP methyl ester carboxylesterase
LLAGVPVSERRLHLGGVATALLEGGEGPPVVLLHGPGEHAAKWFRVLPALVSTHHVIAPDLPGHGASAPVDDLDAARVLGWLAELVARTSPSPPALVGHVLGGAIAARFAVEHGAALRSLVLVDALGLTAFAPAPEFGVALGAFLSEPTADTHERLWARCAFDLGRLRGRIGARWALLEAYNLDRMRAPELRGTQHALMEQFGMPAIAPADLERIRVPTSLVWGRHDLATPLSVARAAAGRHGWPLRVVEDAGDDPAIEQPEAFVEALRASLAD